MTNEQRTFELADWALLGVVQQIADDQWHHPATGIPSYAATTQTLWELINYHVYDDVWVPDTLAGKTIAEVGDAHDGDLLGDDPKAAFAAAVDAAVAAVTALTATDMERPVHLSYGDYPIREYLQHITSFRGFRSYSIARFLGIDPTMSPELVRGLWDITVPNVEAWRAMGVFGPAIPVPDDADQQTKLLGITGFLQTT